VNCWKLLKLYLPQQDAQAWMRRFEKDKDSHSYKKNHCNGQSAAKMHSNMYKVQRLDLVRF
jgi:hypothetical protein